VSEKILLSHDVRPVSTLAVNHHSISEHLHHSHQYNCRDRGRRAEQLEKLRKKCGQTAGHKYNWRKMEAAAQDRAGWRQVVCGPLTVMN